MSNYPPGVTGAEPQITGEEPVDYPPVEPGEAVWSTAAGWKVHLARDATRTLCGRWAYDRTGSPPWSATCRRCLLAGFRVVGFRVVLREFVEDSKTPGFLGQIAGRTDREDREVVVGTHAVNDAEVTRRLAHEFHHVIDPDWACGSADPLGRKR